MNLKTRECDRFTLREDFRPIAVPPGARAMGEVYIGTSAVVGSGVLVKIFGTETERGKVLVVIFSSFGYSTCSTAMAYCTCRPLFWRVNCD